MRKRDVNGNTTSTQYDVSALARTVRDMASGQYHEDSAGYILVRTGDGGHIIFHSSEFPNLARYVQLIMKREV